VRRESGIALDGVRRYGSARSMLPTLALAMLLSSMDVQGDGSCPAANEVESALQSLGTSEDSSHIAQLVEISDGLTLTLRSSRGELLASRRVQTHAECSQRATAVAVVLAAWEADLAGAQQQAPVLPPPPGWRWRVGAEAALGLTHHSGIRLLPNGALLGQLWRGDARWGWLGRIGSSWPSRSPLATADVVWMRPLLSLEAGPWLRVAEALGELHLELTAGVSVLRLWGEGFSVDDSSTGLDVGVSPGLRWQLGQGALRAQLSLAATFWLVPQQVRVAGSSQIRVLPQWELRGGIGLLWGR